LCWLEVGMAYDCWCVHAPRPPVEAPVEAAARLALSRWSCRGVVEAA
jgi:hypothetical protein